MRYSLIIAHIVSSETDGYGAAVGPFAEIGMCDLMSGSIVLSIKVDNKAMHVLTKNK